MMREPLVGLWYLPLTCREAALLGQPLNLRRVVEIVDDGQQHPAAQAEFAEEGRVTLGAHIGVGGNRRDVAEDAVGGRAQPGFQFRFGNRVIRLIAEAARQRLEVFALDRKSVV